MPIAAVIQTIAAIVTPRTMSPRTKMSPSDEADAGDRRRQYQPLARLSQTGRSERLPIRPDRRLGHRSGWLSVAGSILVACPARRNGRHDFEASADVRRYSF